jgi:site-specific DNA-methyltransferase (adenine-specific)
MGHEWDGSGVAFQPETWAAMLRVARPGAWLLTFGGTRTHHRLAVALEDAGWELTDELAWIFAQGMPKGRTTLKPAHEPILLARKPAKRVTPLQIDETRIPGEPWKAHAATGFAADKFFTRGEPWKAHAATGFAADKFFTRGEAKVIHKEPHVNGRWPANVVLTDPVLDAGTLDVVAARRSTARGHVPASRPPSGFAANAQPETNGERHSDEGSYNRYFLIPKAGRRERNAGLEDVDERPMLWSSGTKSPGTFQSEGTKREARNHHPTVKPIELMSHLVRLVCPPGSTVLDPFIGSGSTAVAAIASGRRCIGIELDETYLPLIAKRLRLLRTEVTA